MVMSQEKLYRTYKYTYTFLMGVDLDTGYDVNLKALVNIHVKVHALIIMTC